VTGCRWSTGRSPVWRQLATRSRFVVVDETDGRAERHQMAMWRSPRRHEWTYPRFETQSDKNAQNLRKDLMDREKL